MKTRLTIFGGLIFISLMTFKCHAQDEEKDIFNKIEGYWEGAFIKNNSFQKFDLQFYKEKEQIKSLQIIQEWHPQFGEFVLPVKIDTLGQILFNTGHGKAVMHLDINSLEMTGQIKGKLPAVYVHLKKIPVPPAPSYNVREVNIKNDSITLFGHLHTPDKPSKTAVIIVGGRSCYAGSTKYDLYAKLLRDYGVAVLVFNKRGTGKSSGDCSRATISDLANDVVAAKNYLSKHLDQDNKIGILGSSAGGWVMIKAEEIAKFDFMVSVVGPATSVMEQQLQSMKYGFDFYKLPGQSKSDLLEYTNMMFKAKATASNFARFNELLKLSKTHGWHQLLDDTDIPKSISDINNLWVRRHNYDPKGTLSSFNKPFLAIYGEIDWIVPYQENIKRLNELFTLERKDLLNTIIAYDAEHGTETKGKYITLDSDNSFWRFFRISPIVQIGIIEFLLKYDLIEKVKL